MPPAPLRLPAIAATLAGMLVIAAPASSQNRPMMVAELAAPARSTSFAAGGVVWSCEGTRCVAPASNARQLRLCTALRRAAGEIVRFEGGGAALDAEALARCNGG